MENNFNELIALIGGISSVIGIVVAYFQLKDRVALKSKKQMEKIKGTGNLDRKPDLIFSFFRLGMYKKIPMKVAHKKAKELAKDIEKYQPTIICGIGRGGAIFGSLISYNLFHIPIVVMDRKYNWEKEEREDEILYDFDIPKNFTERVLLVAGETHTGGTMKLFIKHLKQIGAENIKTCVFYKQSICTYNIDYAGIKGDNVPLMPWQDITYIRDSISKENAIKRDIEQKKLYSGKKITAYIVRHAETNENADGDRFIGTTDAVLSEEGKKQAIILGKLLAKEKIDSIFSSPLKRCVDTANFIKEKAGIKSVVITDLLKEMNYGDWENVKRSEVEKLYPEEYMKYEENPFENFPSNAENPKVVVSRIKQFWKEIIPQLNDNAIIVIVTHKTTGRLMICDIKNKDFIKFREEKLANASITKVMIDGHNKEYISYEELL